jgi:hypothetical protein
MENRSGEVKFPMQIPHSRCTHIVLPGKSDSNAPRKLRLQVSVACSALLLLCWIALVRMDRDRAQEDLSAWGSGQPAGQSPFKLPPFVKCVGNQRGSQDCYVVRVSYFCCGLVGDDELFALTY